MHLLHSYVGQLVKESHSTTGGSEYSKTAPAFDMNYNDFPALPGASSAAGVVGSCLRGASASAAAAAAGERESEGLGLGLSGSLGSGFHAGPGLSSEAGACAFVHSNSAPAGIPFFSNPLLLAPSDATRNPGTGPLSPHQQLHASYNWGARLTREAPPEGYSS